ncbi:chloramphenicol-sensitive protein RarD [Paraburkholderia unamae]|uniref:Chloramphenicol-sensitive protein RarD n=2 Tax=Paraburkholderia unamae TaxID=219649 RepID=A0ABX5KKW5_9BURK|nr:EamA family transporter RarD [Paraburkholderia unamae]PVX81280.1 chloramphenicol-sensitive protein RarD [Paraburkholderia unamae]
MSASSVAPSSMNGQATGRGIVLSVNASALFALLSAYTLWLAPLGGLDVFAWRVIWTVPGALLLLAQRGRTAQMRALFARMLGDARTAFVLVRSAALLGVQMWLFQWAPLHGRMLEVSLGYFLLPLVMVLVGRIYYRERLDAMQWLAVACAAAGVAHELVVTHALAWPTLLVAFGYPLYFVLRRKIDADSLTTFAIEMLLLLPVAAFEVWLGGSLDLLGPRPLLAFVLLPGLGALSAVAQGFYLKASRVLPLGLFGILCYLEPVLLVVVSVSLLGEHFEARQFATYGPIWIAVSLTAVHSARFLRNRR